METTCSVVRGIGAYKFGFVNFLLDKLGDPLMLMMQPGVFYLRCCHAGDIAKSPRHARALSFLILLSLLNWPHVNSLDAPTSLSATTNRNCERALPLLPGAAQRYRLGTAFSLVAYRLQW